MSRLEARPTIGLPVVVPPSWPPWGQASLRLTEQYRGNPILLTEIWGDRLPVESRCCTLDLEKGGLIHSERDQMSPGRLRDPRPPLGLMMRKMRTLAIVANRQRGGPTTLENFLAKVKEVKDSALAARQLHEKVTKLWTIEGLTFAYCDRVWQREPHSTVHVAVILQYRRHRGPLSVRFLVATRFRQE